MQFKPQIGWTKQIRQDYIALYLVLFLDLIGELFVIVHSIAIH